MIKKEVTIGNCRLILGDCVEVLPMLNQVDAVITSPPYDNLRTYGEGFNRFTWQDTIAPIAEKLLSGGVLMWNVADATIDGSETGTSFKQALAFMEAGLNLHDTMIYAKTMSNFPDNVRYYNSFEYMFILSNGRPKSFNPIRDKQNIWRGVKIHGTQRDKNGVLSQKGSDTITGKEGMRLNWWVINHEQSCTSHPATMPLALAHDQIISWTNEKDTVLDPFMGSGTTGIACMKSNRNFIGVEINEEYFNIAVERLTNEDKQYNLFGGD